MKSTLTKLLTPILAALLLLTACAAGPDPADDPGYILNQSNAEAPESEIAAFYEGNKGTLTALARGMVGEKAYTAYNFNYRMTDYEAGSLSFYVQKQEKAEGVWATCTEENALRLTEVKFVGSITYDPTLSRDVVIVTPRMAASDVTYALAYCKNEAGLSAVKDKKFHKNATSVTTQSLGDNWYSIEVTK